MTSRIEDAEMNRKSHNNKWRLQKLANLQGYLLRHAISNFPSAKYVFYSTCSLQVEENENVVESVLGCAKLHGYSLINLKKKIKGWENFGSTDYECGRKCIYSRPDRDFTNGGFLAVFKRKFKADLSLFENKEEKMNEGNAVEVKKIKLSEQFFALVNTLKISLEDAIQFFVDNGWKHLPAPMNYNIFLSGLEEDSERVKEKFFEQDFHVKELLLFPRGLMDELSKQFIDQHKFILSDKASCLAVHLLDPSPGSVVLDMSAGNEKLTLHIAARMNNRGTVYAYESDYLLHKELSTEIKMCGMSCVHIKYDSGFYSNSKDCPGVQLILVAPPCTESGSGIAEKTQYSLIKNVDTKNKGLVLRKYIVTQFSLLRRALTEFPEAFRVVYSTHSVNPEENEDIINALLVLANFNGFKLIDVPSRVDGWKNESDNKYHFASKCLITRDKMSITKGFFIAVFERDFKGYSNKVSLNDSDVNLDSSLNTVDCFKSNKRNNKKDKSFSENDKHTPNEEEISDGNTHLTEISKLVTVNDDESLHLNRSIFNDNYGYNCEEINCERIADKPENEMEDKEKATKIISKLQKNKKIPESYDYDVDSDVHECKKTKKQKFDSKNLTGTQVELVSSKKLKSKKKKLKTSQESDEVALSEINEYKKRNKRRKHDNENDFPHDQLKSITIKEHESGLGKNKVKKNKQAKLHYTETNDFKTSCSKGSKKRKKNDLNCNN